MGCALVCIHWVSLFESGPGNPLLIVLTYDRRIRVHAIDELSSIVKSSPRHPPWLPACSSFSIREWEIYLLNFLYTVQSTLEAARHFVLIPRLRKWTSRKFRLPPLLNVCVNVYHYRTFHGNSNGSSIEIDEDRQISLRRPAM